MSNEEWGVGKNAKNDAFDKTKLGQNEVELIHGEYPHSRSDNNTYARTEGGIIYDFDGHRRLIDITITSNNYLKESGLSGDQIRKEVIGRIFSDGEQVYEFFSRDPQKALLRANELIDKLSGINDWFLKTDRDKLIGRKIYYHDHPATITSVYADQGTIMITTEPGFTPPPWATEDDGDSWWDEYKEGDHYVVKADVLEDHIWWWRD